MIETTRAAGPHGDQPVRRAGSPLERASGAMIMIHGRGAGAFDILGLAEVLAEPDLAYLAPEAAGATWYPHRFIEPTTRNQPHLDSALQVVAGLIEDVAEAGIAPEKVILLGFSQGACLASEFMARNGRRYGGLAALSGGVIGADGEARADAGDLAGTPAFLGCSDVDPHIPLKRVEETAALLRARGAAVDARIYPGMGHTINDDQIAAVRGIVARMLGKL